MLQKILMSFNHRIIQRAIIPIYLASIILSIPVGSVEAYSVGVKVGEWATYGVTLGSEPASPSSESILVKSVSNLNVTLSITDGYPNGTTQMSIADFNVLSCDSPQYIKASNLAVNDSICDHTNIGPTIQQSTMRISAGENRTVNIFYTSNGIGCNETTVVYDKLTGLLIEENINYGQCYPTWDMNLTSTNAFSYSISSFTFQSLSLTALISSFALSILKRNRRPHLRLNRTFNAQSN